MLLAAGAGCATAPAPVEPVHRIVTIETVTLTPLADTVAVVPRSTWDETPPGTLGGVTRYASPLAEQLDWIVVHHSAFARPEGPRGIERYHLEVSGFADIGYHFVIGTDGTVYEGRDIERMGAHAGICNEASESARDIKNGKIKGTLLDARRLDPDYGAIGVVVDGFFFNDVRPSLAQHRALLGLVTHLRAEYGIAADHVLGHREVRPRITEARGLTSPEKNTECPGPGLMPLVEHARAAPLAGDGIERWSLEQDAALLEYCYKDWRHRGGQPFVDPVTMRFIADQDGEVLTSEVETEAPVDERFVECGQEALWELRVPAHHDSAPVVVELVVRFGPRHRQPGAGLARS